MSYPSAPDFTSAPADQVSRFVLPAWWTYTRDNGAVNVCESTGANVVKSARIALGISATTAWDSDFQAALVSKAQQLAQTMPGSGWDAFATDLQQQQVTLNALRFAIWIAFYAVSGLRLDAIDAPNAILPAFGSVLPEGPSAGLMACFDPTSDVPVQNLSASDFSSAQQASASGIRIHPGESLPAPAAPIPSGPAGVSTIVLAGAGITLVAVVALIAVSNRSFTTTAKRSRNRK